MKAWVKNNWGFVVVAASFLVWCHMVLIQDAKTLCSNEATAYSECSN